MATCPSCHVELNTSQHGTSLLLCSGCRTVVKLDGATLVERVDTRRLSRLALLSLLVGTGFVSLTAVAFVSAGQADFRAVSGLLFFFCFLFLGMFAVPFGGRALDDIDMPYKRRWGRRVAQAGILLGLLTVVMTMVLVVWSSTRHFRLRLLDNGSLNIGPKPDPNAVPAAPRASIFAEMPTVRGNEAYQLVLDSQTATWNWLFPVADVDPETHYRDFHNY